MFRITALNSVESDESDEIHIAKEAQEAIAESEYVRAITLKTQGKPEIAKKLLTDLLQTHILNEGAVENVEKLCAIRYNCHKYLAIIAEENEDYKEALANYLLAMQIDNTDVNTLYRFGQLALKHTNLELAQYVFETCLSQNMKHWLAINGLLNVYIKDTNILAIYGMALQSIKTNSHSPQILELLKEIIVKFKWILPLGELIYGPVPSHLLEETKTKTIDDYNVFDTNFEETVTEKQIDEKPPSDLPKLKTNNLNFFSIGTHIMSTINYLNENNISMLSVISFHNGLLMDTEQSSPTLTETENLNVDENEIMQISESHGNEAITVESKTCLQTQTVNDNIEINVDSSNSKSDSGDTGKSKSRRRCSDLVHLEQWGWHKTRKAYRKKIQSDRTDVDHTLLGFLRKAFVKYTDSTFDILWPFGSNDDQNNFDGIETNCESCKKSLLVSDFESQVKDIFEKFLNNIKTAKYDLTLLIYWWLKEMSQFYNKLLPDELKVLYIELFSIYKDCYDFSNWNQLKQSTFLTNFQICLFYLELTYSNNIREEGGLSNLWLSTFNHLSFICGCALIEKMDNYEMIFIRLINLEILRDDFQNENEKCIQNLFHMKQILLGKPSTFIVHLPNLETDCISLQKIISKLKEQERLIDLKKIPDLCAEQEWTELSTFIKKYLHNTENCYENENWQNDFINLNELLLQSLWNDYEYEECLIYAEKFLHYSTYYYLQENKTSLSKSITYTLSYIEVLILKEGSEILMVLNEYLARLIQNIIHILSCQLDPDPEKKSYFANELEMRRSWIILHQVLMRDENMKNIDEVITPTEVETPLPTSFMLLFIAHDYLGNRQACTNDGGQFLLYIFQTVIPNLRAPIYDSCRNHAYEYIEQVTYCLFGFPPKKARSRHLEDHNSTLIELTWQAATDIFDIYTPETLPEFNSYKVESITVDMEQFLLKTLSLMPNQYDPTAATEEVIRAIAGSSIDSLKDLQNCELPFKIKNIYYLLGDFYFKTRDFNKAIKYYIYDLAFHIQRFDSWAGISLSKASNIETKLNGLIPIDVPQFLNECEEAIRCFDKCISLVQNHILVWIEYGSFAYTIGSFCSRKLKAIQGGADPNWLPLLTEKKERMLTISYNCFSLAATLQNSDYLNNESFEEKWLCQYMLGKISEKRKESPNIYLNYYLTASNYLYECSATYPIKINHNNPTTLSVEALEIFYRTNAAILKYVESGLEVAREYIVLFKNVLKKLSKSPFAFNKAKIDGSCIYALKRKSYDNPKSPATKNTCKETLGELEQIPTEEVSVPSATSPSDNQENSKTPPEAKKCEDLRRSSQESTATSNTTSTSSLSNFSDSDSSSLDNHSDKLARTQANLDGIYEEALKNLEECVIRFPEHYKSIYRLVHFYLNGPKKLQDLNQCEKLLLHQYRTRVGNIIGGLFYDRKTNNLFNGVWRIPSSEIDRPGSFSAHLVKCVKILIEMLKKRSNYKLCIDIILQLYKVPDNDKRYIMDAERISLYETAIRYCEEIMTDILNKSKNSRNDPELLDLLVDIYKIQKKCYKYVAQKDSWFSKIFVDVYTFYVENKVQNYPKDLNYTDLAVKLCVQEINYRKNLEKVNSLNMNNVQSTYESSSLLTEDTRISYLSGPQYRNRMQTITENVTAETTTFTHLNPIVNDHSSIAFPSAIPSSIDPTRMSEDYARFLEYCKQFVQQNQQQQQQQTTEGPAVMSLTDMSSFAVTENTEKQPDNTNFRFNVNDK